MASKLVAFLLLFTVNVYSLTDTEKQAILDKHNELRAKVARGEQSGQPSAANMGEMKWDSGLATVAQNYADKLLSTKNFAHNPERNSQFLGQTTEYVKKINSWNGEASVGENLAYSWSSGSNSYTGVTATQKWFDEVTEGNYNYNTNSGSGVVGHYTQLIWASSRYLGCGVATDGNYVYVCCNYHPAGNWGGEKPYISGTKGTQCEKDRSLAPVTSGLNAGLCGGNTAVNYYDGFNTGSPYIIGNGINGGGSSGGGGSGTSSGTTTTTTKYPTQSPTNRPTPAPITPGDDDYICIACMDSTNCPGSTYIGTYKKDDDDSNKWININNDKHVFEKYQNQYWVLWLITVTQQSNGYTYYSYGFVDYDFINTHPTLNSVVLDRAGQKLYVKNIGYCPQSYSGENNNKGITYLFKDTTSAVLIIIIIIQCVLLTIGGIICITQKINQKKLKNNNTTNDSPYHQL